MKNKKTLFLLALSAIVAGGCSKSEIDVGSINSTNAISFSTSTDKLTRGTVLDNTTAKNYDFGVYAYQTGTDSWSTATTKTEFMHDQLVEYSTDAWTYSPTKYWPASSDDKISFFGYMPMNDGTDTDVATTAATVNNYLPVITFEQVMEAAKMTDFVVGKALDQTKAASTVTIPFNHVLTRLNFSAKTEKPMSGSAVYISELKILYAKSDALYESGTYTMSDADATNGAWSAESTTTDDLDVTSILNKTDSNIGDLATTVTAVMINSSTTQTGILAADQYLFLIPPYGTDGIKTENDIRLELTYEIITYDDNSTNTNKLIRNEYTKELSLPVGSLVEGKAYNAVITIGLDDVVLSANLTDWEDETIVDALPLPTEVTVSAATDVATNIDNAFTNNLSEFTITYEGDEGVLSVDLSTVAISDANKGMDLVINLPNQSDDVDITIPDGYEGGITIYAPKATVTAETTDGTEYTDVTVTTADQTFIISAGVVVNGLTILGGNVEVYGELSGDVVKGESNTEETTTITFFYGSVKTDATIGDGITVIDDIDAADGLQVGAQDMKEGTTININ